MVIFKRYEGGRGKRRRWGEVYMKGEKGMKSRRESEEKEGGKERENV